MAQAKLIRAEEVENGIKLTFLDFDVNEKSGVYNGKKLDLEDFEKMIGHQMSFSESDKVVDKYEETFTNFMNVHKAWEENGRPSFCDDPKHGMDR